MTGNLYIFSAPSGAGKTSLVKALLAEVDNICVSISHCTRKPRPQEEHGKDYFFVDEQQFLNMAKQSEFIEYAKVFDNYYGTSHAFIDEQLEKGIDVILEIDWQGAQQVRKLKPEAKSLFILPPSIDELKARLTNRSQDASEIIEKRMHQAQAEISHYPEYDFIIMNDEFAKALEELKALIISQRLTLKKQKARYKEPLNNLLAN